MMKEKALNHLLLFEARVLLRELARSDQSKECRELIEGLRVQHDLSQRFYQVRIQTKNKKRELRVPDNLFEFYARGDRAAEAIREANVNSIPDAVLLQNSSNARNILETLLELSGVNLNKSPVPTQSRTQRFTSAEVAYAACLASVGGGLTYFLASTEVSMSSAFLLAAKMVLAILGSHLFLRLMDAAPVCRVALCASPILAWIGGIHSVDPLLDLQILCLCYLTTLLFCEERVPWLAFLLGLLGALPAIIQWNFGIAQFVTGFVILHLNWFLMPWNFSKWKLGYFYLGSILSGILFLRPLGYLAVDPNMLAVVIRFGSVPWVLKKLELSIYLLVGCAAWFFGTHRKTVTLFVPFYFGIISLISREINVCGLAMMIAFFMQWRDTLSVRRRLFLAHSNEC